MKMQFKPWLLALPLMAAYLALSLPIASADPGSEGSGGGHGVVSDGKLYLLDLTEDPESAVIDKVNLFNDPLTKDAAAEAETRIQVLEPKYPDFTHAFVTTLHEMQWYESNVALQSISDSELDIPAGFELPQVAVQHEGGEVLIDQSLASQMQHRGQAGLIVHEGFLAKLGLRVPRKAVRAAVRALFNDKLDAAGKIAAVEKALNPVSPMILAGKYEMSIRVSNDMPVIANVWILDSDTWNVNTFDKVRMDTATIQAHRGTWQEFKKVYDVASFAGMRPRNDGVILLLFGGDWNFLGNHFNEYRLPYEVRVNGVIRGAGVVRAAPRTTTQAKVTGLIK
jgi:hypothetical protein